MSETATYTPEHESVLEESSSGRWSLVMDDSRPHLIVVRGDNENVLDLSVLTTMITAVSARGIFVFDMEHEKLQGWDHTRGVDAASWADALVASSTPLRHYSPELFRSQVERSVEQHIKDQGLGSGLSEMLRCRIADEVLPWSEEEEGALDAAENFFWHGFQIHLDEDQLHDYRYTTDFFWTLEAICLAYQKLDAELRP